MGQDPNISNYKKDMHFKLCLIVYSCRFRRNSGIPVNSCGFCRNSGIPADSGGIRGGIKSIATELPSQDPTSLRAAYAKYKVLVSSSKQMLNLRSNQEWTDHLEEFGIEKNWFPVFADLANIFISKSPADDYSLGDLKDWLGKKDVAKGKKPAATGSSAGKKEKRKKDKRVTSESSSSESSEEKNVKAKAKGKKGKKKASE